MYFRKKTSGGRAYLQIVESRREGAALDGCLSNLLVAIMLRYFC